MRVLVTGGAGFIGSHIVGALSQRGHTVWVLDNLSSGKRANIPYRDQQGQLDEPTCAVTDITDAHALNRAIEWIAPDVISHQAAQPSLRRSIDDPAHDAQVNIIGTMNVIEAAKRYKVQHLVFASTSAVYDPAGGTFTEDSPIRPNLPYGIAKATAEQYLRHSGLSHTILRYGNVYGPRQVPVGENQLIPHALAHIYDGAPFVINGDGEQTRDWVYVEDIARANVLALEGTVQGVYNCGRGGTASVNAVCSLLKGITGWAEPWQHGPAKPGEARAVMLDSSAAEAWGWRAETGLHTGLLATIAWWTQRGGAL